MTQVYTNERPHAYPCVNTKPATTKEPPTAAAKQLRATPVEACNIAYIKPTKNAAHQKNQHAHQPKPQK